MMMMILFNLTRKDFYFVNTCTNTDPFPETPDQITNNVYFQLITYRIQCYHDSLIKSKQEYLVLCR